ncbi:uncharacterized protein LOC107457954 [Arachis duranensis]|uniref:Uncharacterized protein LOC107457954 n=1 Tax=Arachis duranensis TaxID=130453 RepID=A0A6P4B3T7_ARADU|nr:uncharacterized protein LOC107457954 [Arachis duranensis]
MAGNFMQNDNYDYAQPSSEQNNYNNRQFQSQQQQPPQQANSKSQEDSKWEMMMSFMQETRASVRNLEVAGCETKVNEDPVEGEAREEKKEEVEHAPPKRADNPFPDSLDNYPALPKAPEYKPKMSYPQRLQKASKEKQFSKFLDVFKKLQINIPFAEALEQMPLYAKFMKELLTHKRNWKEQETMVVLNVFEALKHPNDSEGCMKIDVIEPLVQEVLESEVFDDVLDPISEYELVEVNDSPPQKKLMNTLSKEEEAPKLELKPLPPSLKYVFLGENDSYPVISSSSLKLEEEEALVSVLKSRKTALGWTISDL